MGNKTSMIVHRDSCANTWSPAAAADWMDLGAFRRGSIAEEMGGYEWTLRATVWL